MKKSLKLKTATALAVASIAVLYLTGCETSNQRCARAISEMEPGLSRLQAQSDAINAEIARQVQNPKASQSAR